jgi:hypothetical protein
MPHSLIYRITCKEEKLTLSCGQGKLDSGKLNFYVVCLKGQVLDQKDCEELE